MFKDTPDAQAVEAFLKEELSKVQAMFGTYAGISVSVRRHIHADGPAEFTIDWGTYIDGSGNLPAGTQDHAFTEMGAALQALKRERTPEAVAQRLREQAAEFLKRADELTGAAT